MEMADKITQVIATADKRNIRHTPIVPWNEFVAKLYDGMVAFYQIDVLQAARVVSALSGRKDVIAFIQETSKKMADEAPEPADPGASLAQRARMDGTLKALQSLREIVASSPEAKK